MSLSIFARCDRFACAESRIHDSFSMLSRARRSITGMKRFLSALAASLLGLWLAVAAPIAASAAPAPQIVTITASATNLFSPSAITVHAGQPVELKLVGISGVHGVESSALGIPATTIMPGTTQTVTFTPAKAGTYILHCTIPCGMDHGKMMIVITVV
jgi:cytochrome c oxidase subunit 2